MTKDFTSRGVSLHSFKDTDESSEETSIGGKHYSYGDILYLIEKHTKIPRQYIENTKGSFWDMFICDAILGNRDRHRGNWGYLKTSKGYFFSPIYDNGGSLYPQVLRNIDGYISIATRKNWLETRVLYVPASVLQVKRPNRYYKSNYYNIFSEMSDNEILSSRAKVFTEKVSYSSLYNKMISICNELPVDSWLKRFYIEIVVLRYMCIILRLDFDSSYKLIEGWLSEWLEK